MGIKTAIILAAGKGTRLRSVTGNEFPKPLTPIKGKPIIEYSIEALQKAGVNRILIGCGHQIESFEYLEERYKEVQIVENPLYDVRGSIYTFLLFEKLVKDSFYLLEADILYDPEIFSKLGSELDSSKIVTSAPLNLDDDVYFTSEKGRLTSLTKKLSSNKSEGVMTGIWAISEGFLQRYSAYCNEINIDFSEDYETIVAQFSADKEQIKIAHFHDLNWCEIDNEHHLDFALKNVLPGILS